jgi:hypothetical protein
MAMNDITELFDCQTMPQNYLLNMTRLMGLIAVAQKTPQYFPEISF